jgi:hypothetical protein
VPARLAAAYEQEKPRQNKAGLRKGMRGDEPTRNDNILTLNADRKASLDVLFFGPHPAVIPRTSGLAKGKGAATRTGRSRSAS